ncbi:MAG: NADH:ubiquinone reductase (Na(+)-transporting) subunit C [Bacteroidota bacterium]
MTIDKDSNVYTFIFSVVLCVVTAVALAITAQKLKPYQDANILNEKKQNILAALQIDADRDKEAASKFEQHVKEAIILDAKGVPDQAILDETKGDKTAMIEKALSINALDQFKGVEEDKRLYPLYICENEGKKYYVMPVGGQGLWAGIWGYLSVGEDMNTVAGASFDHKSETPGLGAEINTPFFEGQFPGKKLNDATGNFVSIRVVKPGSPKTEHNVDGISGGTFTSKGVDEMITRCLTVYSTYFKSLSSSTASK